MNLVPLLVALATNVPAAWTNTLSWSMLIIVAVFLISGPTLVYSYYKKYQREKAASPATAA